MHELSKTRESRAFPATSGRRGAIDASRASRRGPIVRTGRPESGRGPASAGLHDDSAGCVFARVPGVGVGWDHVALCETGGVHAVVRSTDEADALRRAIRTCDAPVVACEPALAGLAASAGLRVQPLTRAQQATVAFLALLFSIGARLSEAAFETLDLQRLFHACAALTRAAPWRHASGEGRIFEIAASGRGPQERLALVLREEGEEFGPGFVVCDYDVSLRFTPFGQLEIEGDARYFVTLAEVPPFARAAFEAAFGSTHFPVVGHARRCRDHGRLRLDEARLMTGVIECVAQLAGGSGQATSTVDLRKVTLVPHRDEALLGDPSGSA